MSSFVRWLAILFSLSSILTVVEFRDRARALLLWIPKVMVNSLSPVIALVGIANAALGLRRRDWLAMISGGLGTLISALYMTRVSTTHHGFPQAFGPDWEAQIPESLRHRRAQRRWVPVVLPPPAQWQRDLVYGVNPTTQKPLLADLWLPPPEVPQTGLGIVFVHGGAWQIGRKDMRTRTHFRRLAGQGHIVLDIAYSLAPHVDIPTMVGDVKRGIVWLKQNGPQLGVSPDRVVVMGGSAGGHLALLAAYTPNDPLFQPLNSETDTSVRGVVAFYPPTDLNASYETMEAARHAFLDGRKDQLSKKVVELILQISGFMPAGAKVEEVENLMARMLGVTPAEDPDRYRLLSPLHHVNSHCPPTLLLQSAADTFAMTPDVRRLHEALRQAGVPSILVELPKTDHAFDLYLPQISPPAQAAMYDMERFLALLV